jgi:hypothetical protein
MSVEIPSGGKRGYVAKAILWIGLVFCLLSTPSAKALIVDLDAYVANPILQQNLLTPLADGSWVFIMGSSNNVNDGMATFGGTNIIAASVLGDDVILGMIQIPLGSTNNSGKFFTTVQYESDNVKYAYLRFFNTTSFPITGSVYWGTSSMFQLGVTLGVSTVQFDQGTQLATTNQNNFVVIPEPSSMNLFILVAGMLWTMRARMKTAMTQEAKDQQIS